jgi:rhodanese-related sulfurtransferase
MTRNALLTLAVVLFGFAHVAAQPDDLAAVPRISLDEFKKLLAKDAIVVLDVRDAASYHRGHIPHARSLPLADLKAHADELKAIKKPIVTYCA